jgi:membrane protein
VRTAQEWSAWPFAGILRAFAGATGTREHLKCRLAVTVFEFGAREPVSMEGKQRLAPFPRDQRDRLNGLEHAEAPQATATPPAAAGRRREHGRLGAGQSRLLDVASGRHESMSVPVARTPPSQFVRERLQAFERYQRRSPRLGFVVAVLVRYDEDQGSQMGALIAYYGFFSLFPLLLVFVTVLGFVLQGNASAQESLVHSTLSQFPIIGTQLQSNVHSLKGSVVALVIGLLGALLAGLGITGATQSAFNNIWQIPRRRQLGFLAWRLRGLGLLAVLGLLSVISTVAAGYVTAQTAGIVAVLIGVLGALVANLLLFFVVFRMLTAQEVDTRDLIPGVILAAVLWQLLAHVGGIYVDDVVRHAKETSGLFAFVLGLLTWLYLGGQVLVLAAEVNVVRASRLWPRGLFSEGT